jgi:FkbM family methyltransferase
MECTFTNDNNVKVTLPIHAYSNLLMRRVNAEKLFRQINVYLINNGIIDKTKNVIDLGTYIGDNSIPWSRIFEGTIYAIDPSSENGSFIKEVKDINNLDNLVFIEKAISDKVSLVSTNDDLHHCMFNEGNSGSNVMETTSLDELFKSNTITNIGYIHLDVEGMENLVVKGAENIIDVYKPVISFEQHIDSDDYIGLSNHLKSKGYVIYLINEVFEGCRVDCRNLLAIPKENFYDNLIGEIQAHLNNDNLMSTV